MARKHLLAITAVAVLALIASACGASGGDKQAEGGGDGSTTTAAAQEAAAGSFGDLPAPVCGPGKDKVAEGEGGTLTLRNRDGAGLDAVVALPTA